MNKFRQFLRKKSISLSEVAKRADITLSRLSSLANLWAKPTREEIKKLTNAFSTLGLSSRAIQELDTSYRQSLGKKRKGGSI